ncbi:MAG: hypothetical protein EXS05_22530 [Planctomycetaceae bacterium]|nr:hypothetical protein [Planctomycetaceae bacterium]
MLDRENAATFYRTLAVDYLLAHIRTMPQPDRLTKLTWRLVVLAVVSYCILSFFFWSLVDVLTPFIAPLLWLPVLAVALAAVVVAIVLPIRRWRTQRIRSLLPLGFFVACFIATRFISFTELWLAANFRLRHTDRENVVKRIASGELRPNVSHNASLIALPRKFAPVSLGGGEVDVQRDGDKLKILFFTYRGVLDPFAGFVYTSDGSAPKDGDFNGEFFVNRKVEDRWYYVSAGP